jgi:hypothetical protein
VDLVGSRELVRQSRLSAKALRLYDELGLLSQARVDPDSGYRWYEAATRKIAARSLLCLLRHVAGEEAAFALGKEFIALLRARPLPLMQGRSGAVFQIYHGEVTPDSDGPLEWCRPVPDDQAEKLAARSPELTLRREPAADSQPDSDFAVPLR